MCSNNGCVGEGKGGSNVPCSTIKKEDWMKDTKIRERYTGLIAAVFTPMKQDRTLNLGIVPAIAEHLIGDGVRGFYVCGTTGEGPLLSSEERRAVAQA